MVSEPGVLDLLAEEVNISVTVSEAEDLTAPPEDSEDPEDAEDPEDPDAPESPEDPEELEDTEESENIEDSDDPEEAVEDADPDVVISIARDVDAAGWIGESPAVRITGLSTRDALRTENQNPEAELESALSTDSDLWQHSAAGTGTAELDWQKEPGRWSVVIASSAEKQISGVEFTWPQDTATPLALPLLLVGGFLLLGGAVWLALPQVTPYLRKEKPEPEVEEPSDLTRTAPPASVEGDSAEEVPREDLPDVATPAAGEADEETAVTSSQMTAEEEPEPVVRFTPGTMTRRQIRELERARRQQALAADDPDKETTDPAREETPSAPKPAEDADARNVADDDGETPRFGSRSEQWRKTWGVASDASDTDRINRWLPREVGDADDGDDAEAQEGTDD